MLSAQDNELLTRTGSGTPMGDYFRRFWVPVALSEELPHPDCDPVRVTIMGECLLAFRDTAGRVGLVSPRCPHRGADLWYGRNEEGGLRCAFHGWKFDVTGQCLEMPTVPADAAYRQHVSLPSYPVQERGDFIWAYLGPAGSAAELPQIEFMHVPDSHRVVQKKLQECNWAQAVEGGLDTAHFSFLHMPAPKVAVGGGATSQVNADQKRLAWMRNDPMPRFTVREHACGFVAGAARTADDNDLYWRVSQFMLPNHALAPNALAGETYQGQTFVPIDDHSCWIYCYAWNPERPLTDEERTRISGGHGVFAALGPGYVPLRNRSNNYLIDRREQRASTFTGVKGVSEQDAMIQDSQGLIADRTLEHLGPTDLAVVWFRRQVMGGAKALRDADQFPAASARGPAYRLRGGSSVADASVSFDDVMQRRFGDSMGRTPA
jgi:phenylpropionate dioxygenase-like ring-hydroxylating dioxygenase large terminal subunit